MPHKRKKHDQFNAPRKTSLAPRENIAHMLEKTAIDAEKTTLASQPNLIQQNAEKWRKNVDFADGYEPEEKILANMKTGITKLSHAKPDKLKLNDEKPPKIQKRFTKKLNNTVYTVYQLDSGKWVYSIRAHRSFREFDSLIDLVKEIKK